MRGKNISESDRKSGAIAKVFILGMIMAACAVTMLAVVATSPFEARAGAGMTAATESGNAPVYAVPYADVTSPDEPFNSMTVSGIGIFRLDI